MWIKEIQNHPLGLAGFIDHYLQAKKGQRAKRKLDGLLIERICNLKEEMFLDSLISLGLLDPTGRMSKLTLRASTEA